MPDKSLSQVESVFHAVLDLPPHERASYLENACLGDERLYAEVSSLISALDSRDGFMEQPGLSLGLKVLSRSSEQSMISKSVGPYKVILRLGKGGMGEVYLADDTRLGRKVALKFISQEFIGDNWARRQLVKEAQAVAMLDHPNICPVYGIEEEDGHSFIVMQYVEGETLADLIRTHSLPTNKIVPLAQQIVGAVAEAHAHGIIHRDIKPKNIMVTPSGQAKVLDFGLAKTIQQHQNLENTADSISHLSQAGLIPGTVAYMSPEQLRGEKLDYRSDVFSLGTVLYETVTGKNPYAHDTNVEIISAILSSKPASFKKTSARASRDLDRIVQKCLEKRKEERYQSSSDLLLDLEATRKVVGLRRPISHYLTVRCAAAFTLLSLFVIVSIFIYFQVTRPKSVAVLPLANESNDHTLEYLAEGLTDSITNRLSGLSKLQVKASTLVSGYKGSGVDPVRIGRDLGVDAILVGKIYGNRTSLVLRTTLISVQDGAQLWGEERPIDLENVFLIEQEVSQRVISKLELWSRVDENRSRSARQPTSPEARNEYMLGRYFWRNRDNNRTLKDAIEHFNAAIKLDPNYAQAHAGLADCYALGNVVSYPDLGMTTIEAMNRAERAAKDALDRDENLAEAHTSLGFVNMKFHRNWQEAEREFRTAIELKPDYALAYYGYSNLRAITGPESEAISWSLKAKELDPFSPVAALNFCRSYYYARRYDEASTCFDKLVEDNPDYTNGRYSRAFISLQQGLKEEAIRVLESLYAKDKRSAAAALGYAYGISGNKEAARRVLSEMETLSKESYIPSQEFALIYLGLKDNENTFFWLNKAARERLAMTSYIAVDPIYDPIRSDTRFIELARSLNLPLQPPT
jgi:serine/threonine protein kinase/tetratricopeptide (TPR) repeat protein